MTPVRYITGDATRPHSKGPVIIAHICNDTGHWGAGFVLAVSRRWPQPELSYRRWFRERDDPTSNFGLGGVHIVPVQQGIWVANMIGQHGVGYDGKRPPIRYSALRSCLRTLAGEAVMRGASVHMPRIGCGLAGGKWERVGQLVEAELVLRGISVFVYDLPDPARPFTPPSELARK